MIKNLHENIENWLQILWSRGPNLKRLKSAKKIKSLWSLPVQLENKEPRVPRPVPKRTKLFILKTLFSKNNLSKQHLEFFFEGIFCMILILLFVACVMLPHWFVACVILLFFFGSYLLFEIIIEMLNVSLTTDLLEVFLLF